MRLASLLENFKTLGWRDGALYTLSRMVEAISMRRCRIVKYYLVAQPVAAQPLVSVPPAPDFLIAQVDAHNPLVAQFPRPEAVIRGRYASGAVCFAASKQGRLVGFIWLKHGSYHEDEVRCVFVPLPTDTAIWDFDVYVDPAFRLSRAFLRLWDAAYAYLRAQGIVWTMSRISGFNADSLTSHARLGAVRLGQATFLCLGSWQLCLSRLTPGWHFSRRVSDAPNLQLRAPIEGSPSSQASPRNIPGR